jgi:hypothetical protein
VSYDLYFCSRERREPFFDDVIAWSGKYPPFKKTSDTQLFYENEDTRAYFTIEQSSTDDTNELDTPTGMSATGLSFNVNYVRPTFFALEAMPVAESLAREFDLTMLDPQGEGTGAFSADQLTVSWSKSNRWAISAVAERDPASLFYLSPDRATGFWRYMSNYPALTKELESDGVFVPRQSLIAQKNSQRAGTALVWTQGIQLVIPQTDWIFVVYPKSFWRREDKILCFSSETVLAPMEQYLREYDRRRGLRILPPENRDKADKILKNLPGGLAAEDVKRLSPDRCVDVPFGEFAIV